MANQQHLYDSDMAICDLIGEIEQTSLFVLGVCKRRMAILFPPNGTLDTHFRVSIPFYVLIYVSELLRV